MYCGIEKTPAEFFSEVELMPISGSWYHSPKIADIGTKGLNELPRGWQDFLSSYLRLYQGDIQYWYNGVDVGNIYIYASFHETRIG